jgi:hypothetical protein
MFRKTILLSSAFLLGMAAEKSFAVPPVPVLLTINDSDPSVITITATGLNAGVNNSGRIGADGVDLLGFFSDNESSLLAQLLPNSTLSGGGLALSYNDLAGDNYSFSGGNSYDLSFYVGASAPGSSDPETFSINQPAFTGSWTIDLAGLGLSPSALPGPGSQGQIFSGNFANPGAVIGQWEVSPVPEPAIGGLLVVAAVTGLLFARRRTAAL